MHEQSTLRWRGRSTLRFGLLMLAVALLAGCASAVEDSPVPHPAAPLPAPPPAMLTSSVPRESTGIVASGGSPAPYNYGPTVLQESGGYRAWWCSQLPGVGPAGDDILHAASGDLDATFGVTGVPAIPVFNGRPGGFDGMHTCDPSVLKVRDRYYLYYTGAAGDHAHGNAIGVASSADGLAWRREAGSRAIVRPSDEVHRRNVYGAGQPSAVYLDGWFYLMFTDTTGGAAGHNGAGQFVLRARDPEFSDRVQSLTGAGFEPVGATNAPRTRSVVDAFSADWMWVEALGAFAIAHQTNEGTTITFWDREFSRHPYRPLLIPGPWQEGPGLVRQSNGHAPVSPTDPCGRVPIDVLRATVLNPSPSEMRHFGLDVLGARGCGDPARAAAALNGFAIPSPKRTVDVIREGVRIRVERRSVAEKMARSVLDDTIPAIDGLPVAGTISAQARALRSPGGEFGLLDNFGHLWTVDSTAVEANDSTVTDVSRQEWDSHARGGDLTGSRG